MNKPEPLLRLSVKVLAFLALGLLSGTPTAGHAQSWPGTKPLRFEVIGAAGGLPDAVTRTLSDALSSTVSVPVVVEDRPGAGGNLAAGVVAKAEPDGHTLLVTSTNQAVSPMLLPNPGFSYERDLTPVAMVARAKMLLVASPGFAANTIADVIAVAKQKPKTVSIAVPAIGTPNQLAAEMLAQYGNVDLTFVPYDGIPMALPDLMANRVDLTVGAVPTVLPLIRSGALKAVAVLSPQPSPLAADIPTSTAAGLPQLQIDDWICVMTTGGTPAPIIARLDEEIAKTLAMPRVRDAFAKQDVEIFHLNPAQLGAFLHAESARFRPLLENARDRSQ
jgi:tripartite-type tricarboxylate transporter receptor subunit TctC